MDISLYTDGSYKKENAGIVRGGMVTLFNGELICSQRYYSKENMFVCMNNVGGELIAAIGGLFVIANLLNESTEFKQCKNLTIVTLYHDYEGVEKFITGSPKWRAQKAGSLQYVAAVDVFRRTCPDVVLRFKKVQAHSGDKWNTVADKIAGGYIPDECKGCMLPEIDI